MKNRYVEPDEYYNDGIVELVRDGNIVSMKGLLSKEQHEDYYRDLALKYEDEKSKIDVKIENIREMISRASPIDLLNFSNAIPFLSMIGKVSEIEYNKDDIYLMRCTEYIQSVLVSNPNVYNDEVSIDEEFFHKIIDEIIDLYKTIQWFYWYWGAYAQHELGVDDEIVKYIIEAQMLWNVRGKRYQFQQVEDLQVLLGVHNEVFKELFNMSAEELIKGLKAFEYSLSSGKSDSIMEMTKHYDDWLKFIETEPNDKELEKYLESKREIALVSMDKVFGNELYDVESVTGWSKEFIEELSIGLNGDKKFFSNSEFAGWPIINLPIQLKPFIKLGDKSYCFDYYNFFDNIYRIIQKSISRLKPEYTSIWSKKQQDASELLVEEIFRCLLPGANIHRENYYPRNKSLKDMAENDLMVIFDNIVIIIEVKAGSFTYTPPITDYQAHFTSFKSLIEKADFQCIRTLDYLKNAEFPKFYSRSKNEKYSINMESIKDIFTISVTVDNFNEFEAKAEKLSFINMASGSIAISIDDLRIYSHYFDNPLKFIHFLKERRAATKSKLLAFNDELDHLGMYLKHNMYSMYFGEHKNSTLNAYGYREDLDYYFGTLHHKGLAFSKPQQDIPLAINSILDLLRFKQEDNKTVLSNFLLDLSFEARKQFSDSIEQMLQRQKEIGRMITMVTYGESNYSMYVYQPDIELIPENVKLDYIFSSILMHKEKKRMVIDLYFDSQNILQDVIYESYKFSDIPKEDYMRLKEKSIVFAKSRADSIKRKMGIKKIGRNSPCPCGSGKKYKKCCINKI